MPFDLVDGGAIDRLGGAIFERFKKLDIWVHAAATMGPSGLTPVSHADPREFAGGEDGVVQFLQTALRAGGGDDVGASLGQRERAFITDAARGADDKGDTVVQRKIGHGA